MTSPQKPLFNNEVAAIRAMAILAVLGYHFFPSYFPWGYLGVDGFFVISGFLMIPLINRNSNLIGFINNRIRRLYPALLIFVSLYVALGYLFLLNDEYAILLESSIGSLWHFQNILEGGREGYFADTNGFRPFLHIWSLAVEFQVYLLLGLVLLFLYRKQNTNNKIKFIFVLFLISLASYLISIYGYRYDPFFLSPLRFWEFLSGSLLYYLMSSTHTSAGLDLFKKSGIQYVALVIIGFFIYLNGGQLKNLSTILTVLFCVLFIYSVDLSKLHRNIKRSYVYIGAISYSLYIFHYPAIEFLERFVGSPSVLERGLIIVSVFFISHMVDLQITPRMASFNQAGKKLFLGSLALSALVILLYVNLDSLGRGVVSKNSSIDASNSFDIDYNDSCVSLENGGKYIDERCRIGSSLKSATEPNFIIIGDSLSNSITTMFESLSATDNKFSKYIQLGKGYCPIVFDFGNEDCKKFKYDVESFLDKYKSRAVVIAAQWPLYFYSDDVKILDDRKKELMKFIDKHKNNGSNIYLIHSVPLGAKPRTCVARFPWSNLGDCDIPHEISSERSLFAHGILEEIAKDSGVLIFDPAEYMCDSIGCAVFRDREILYLDDSHLSKGGGKYLAEKSINWWHDNFK